MALLGQRGGINQHAVALNAIERLAAGNFELVYEVQLLIGFDLGPQHAVHVQRLIAVFARILGRLGHVHLRKRDLVRALAAQVFIRNATAPQVALGKAGQTVGFVHFEHVALQHGVVRIPLDLNAMVGEDMAVVLDVLPQFELARVFQPGLEFAQDFVHGQLLGRIGPGVGQRDVRGFARFHAEGNAHDLGLHFV